MSPDALPAGWSRTPLSELLNEEDVRAVTITDRSLEVLSLTKRFGLVPQSDRFNKRVATEDISKYKVVRPGWIAYNPYVIWEGAIHALRRTTPGVVSPAYVVWRRLEDDGGYVDHLLRSPDLIAEYERLSAGAVNRRRSIKKMDFLAIEVHAPPLDEQRGIAALLNGLRLATRQQECLEILIGDLKRACLNDLFLTDARPREDWRSGTVGSLARLASGGTPSRSKDEYWSGGTIPWVKTAEVANGVVTTTEERITEAGLQNSSAKRFPPGTLLMAMYGQGVTRGRVALLGIEAATNQACVAFFPNGEVSPEFLFYLFQARYEDIRTYGHGANQPNLSAEIIKRIEISYPASGRKQAEIVALLQKLDRRIAIAQAARRALISLYDAVLSEVYAGRLRVPATLQQDLQATLPQAV